MRGDILDKENLGAVMKGHNVLIHHAGLVSHDPRIPISCEVHVDGTKMFLKSQRNLVFQKLYMSQHLVQ